MFNFKNKKLYALFRSCLSLLLVFSLLAPTAVYANSGGAQGGGSNSGGGKLPENSQASYRRPGVGISIYTIDNIATAADKEKIAEQNKSIPNGQPIFDECGLSVVDSNLYTFPAWMADASYSMRTALVQRDAKATTLNAGPHYYVTGTGNLSYSEFAGKYAVKRNAYAPASYNPEFISSLILNDAALKEKLISGQLTLKEVKDLASQNKGALQGEIAKLLHVMSTSERIAPLLNSILSFDGNLSEKTVADYLDLLVIVNYMVGENCWDDVENFLKTLNGDGAEQFTVIYISSLVSYDGGGGKSVNEWYTIPTFFSVCTAKPAESYYSILGLNKEKVKYLDQKTRTGVEYSNGAGFSWLTEYGNQVKAICGGKSVAPKMFKDGSGYVWFGSAQKNASSVMPTNRFGQMVGTTGFTYFSTSGMRGKTVKEAKGDIYLEATPDGEKVEDSNKPVAATLSVNLGIRNKDKQKKALELDKTARQQNCQPTLKLQFSMDKVEGNGASTAIIDQFLSKLPGATLKNNELTVPNVSRSNFEKLVKGDLSLEFADTDIRVTPGKTVNRYYVSGSFDYPCVGSKIIFKSVGKEESSKGKLKASDTASWVMRDPKDEVGWYYSEMEEPYVEIKEGAPDNEHFEAMAGVPTTEDLYVGFGATEFMMNMDVEAKTNKPGTRTFKLTFTCTQCIEQNQRCTGSCPGPVTNDKGEVTHPAHSQLPCGGYPCSHNQNINQWHPHTHTYTATVTVPINEFKYTDITGMDLWQVNRLIMDGNDELFSNPDHTLDPDTGYRTFYNQEDYKPGNGRLIFSYSLNPGDKYSDTSKSKTVSSKLLKTEVDQQATDWFNSLISGKQLKATVVSDYAVLTTTEGYQSAMYHDYDSDTITLGSFSTGAENKTMTAPNLTFSKVPTWNEFWWDNSDTAADWDDDEIVRSGYNGKYSTPETKWNNKNGHVQKSDPSKHLGDHPNSDNKSGDTDFNKGFDNLRMTYIGLNIIDSTDENMKWSATDGVDPVSNGFWDTGNCYLEADKEIDFKDTFGGNDYSNNGTGYRQEVTYGKGKDKVNDIVVHNPVSVEGATVVCNDKKYDQRTEESLQEGGDPVNPQKGCPGDSSCQFSILDCKQQPSPHTDSCYEIVNIGRHHVGGLNYHEHNYNCYHHHNAGCYAPTKYYWKYNKRGCTYNGDTIVITHSGNPTVDDMIASHGSSHASCFRKATFTFLRQEGGNLICGKTENDLETGGNGQRWNFNYNGNIQTFTAPVAGDYRLEVWGAAGGGWGNCGHAEGGYSTGIVHLNAGQTLYVVCGGHGRCTSNWSQGTGYNGGGKSGSSTGGGATHIATANGVLRNLSNNRDSVLIVAGGGGSNGYWGSNGRGGGLEGEGGADMNGGQMNRWYDLGGKQNSTGTQGGKGGFGYGGDGSSQGGAGGGGWYGGCGAGTNGVSYYPGGGGGSGYLNPSLRDARTQIGGSGDSDGRAVITSLVSACDGKPNTHHCINCTDVKEKVLTCMEPHHYKPGEPWDPKNPKNHYDFGDPRCYRPCMDDSKHSDTPDIDLGNGQIQSNNDIFVNLDREFKIYYPSVGDFAQSPNLHGIGETTSIRGMGYTDSMDVSKWTRDKFVLLPFDVIDADGKPHKRGVPIDLKTQKHDGDYYTFYITLGNWEAMNTKVEFNSIANNAKEVEYYSENEHATNRDRYYSTHKAKHTAFKRQLIDVLGYIGALTINDTQDYRFATLFKQKDPSGGWLIDNIVPRVDYNKPNKVVSDNITVRQDPVSDGTQWHDTYGNMNNPLGGKAHQHVMLPLTPKDNPIKSLQNQPMRPGYNLLMDIETVGNYYGENRRLEDFVIQDNDLYYKMQITPRYWSLNLDTKKYTPVDVYMNVRGSYKPVVKFGNSTDGIEEFYQYLDWSEESGRRNYTAAEKDASITGKDTLGLGLDIPSRLPIMQPEIIGTANRLFLNDLDRTFIGSPNTYGQNKNPDNAFYNEHYNMQAQRWHFTLGLPSSSVFVEKGKPCNTENIKALQDQNSVIVCAIDIKVKGDVWTLEYDGSAVNTSDNGGIQIVPDGPIYPVPIDPITNKPLDDPIVVVYDKKQTAKHDLSTEGSH